MIDQETIERIREQTDIVSLIGESVKLARSGRSVKGLCPFHKEKTPSFNVNPDTGRYFCFGCQAAGDVFTFVQATEGLSFVEAVRHLAERAGITIVERRSAEQNEEAEARRRKQELYDANNSACVFFERMLNEHPLAGLARAELERRGLVPASPTDPVADALQAFRIGYAPYGWDALARHFVKAGISPRAGEALGLLVARHGAGHYDRFRNRLVFAILDLAGRVVGFSCRALPDPSPGELRAHGIEPANARQDEEIKIAKYINSPESPIYHKGATVFGLYQARQHVRQSEHCVLVEGNFDVLGLHARGIKNVAAPLGTAFTAEQAAQIRRFAPTVVLLFDGDRAGRAAVAKSRGACSSAALSAKVASLPDGVDPDELARTQGPEAIQKRIMAARGMLEYLIDSALDHLPPKNDAVARLQRVEEVAKLIASEEDPAVRSLATAYANDVVARLGIPQAATFRALWNGVRREARIDGTAAGPRPGPQGRRTGPRPALDPRETISREILGALLDYPTLLSKAEVVVRLGHIEGDVAAAIAVLRREWEAHVTSAQDAAMEPVPLGRDGLVSFVEQVLAKLPPSIHQFAAARLAAPRIDGLEDARTELLQNLDKLTDLELVHQERKVLEELQHATVAGDDNHEVEVLKHRQAALEAQAMQWRPRARQR